MPSEGKRGKVKMAKGVKKFSYQVLDEFRNQEGYPRSRPHLKELTVLQILHIHYFYAQFSIFSTCASSPLPDARRSDSPLPSPPLWRAMSLYCERLKT